MWESEQAIGAVAARRRRFDGKRSRERSRCPARQKTNQVTRTVYHHVLVWHRVTRDESSPGPVLDRRSEGRNQALGAAAPAVEWLRPPHCDRCGAPSHPVGERLNLVGHGKRQRQVWGPLAPGDPASLVLVFVRRFLCLLCGRSMTVWPPSVVPRRYYSGGAILLALALWGLVGLSSMAVREQISPMKQVEPSVQSWRSLGRWVRAVLAGGLFAGAVPVPWEGLSWRQAAARIVQVMAPGPLSESPQEQAHRAFYVGAASA